MSATSKLLTPQWRIFPAHERRERFDDFRELDFLHAPVQQVEIDAVGFEPLQAALAGLDRAATRGVLRQHLADEENLVAPVHDRRADELLGTAVAVHFRGVDQVHAEIEAEAQRRNFLAAPPAIFAHAPGALPERWHGLAARKLRQRNGLHGVDLNTKKAAGSASSCLPRIKSGGDVDGRDEPGHPGRRDHVVGSMKARMRPRL